MKSIKTKIAAVIVAAALVPFAAMAHQGESHTNPAFGTAVTASASTRTVVITPSTKYVNVNKGDVVTFQVDGKTFTWLFDTLRDNERFELAAIAPEGTNTHAVRVYVAPNPLYAN